MTTLHRQGEIVRDPKGTRKRNRYQIITTIGTGGMATTYAAVDLTNSQRVALKVVSLEHSDDWKTIELFEREAKVLANLHHPFIPRYLDYFELDYADSDSCDRRFYLVQELVEGESLAALVERGWQPNETEVKEIALQVLDILVYLHSLSPPVIHRDIKPQNIIRDRQGKVYLVDFGAVQAVYRNTISISGTFVGTLGYMSPEQLRGNVVPASDLYSLGCSLIFLLTRKLPTDLPQKRMKLDFRSEVDISEHFADWLDRMLEPAIEDRFADASAAIDSLKLKPAISLSTASKLSSHFISHRISLYRQSGRHLQIQITDRGASCICYPFLILGVVWSAVTIGLFLQTGKLIFIPVGLIGIHSLIGSIAYICYTSFKKTILEINSRSFRLKWTKFSWRKGLTTEKIMGNTADIDWVNVNIDKKRNNGTYKIINTCAISQIDRQHKFGLGYNLSLKEAENVTQEVAAFLKQLR